MSKNVLLHWHKHNVLCFYVTILGYDRIYSEDISTEQSKSMKQLNSLQTLTRVYADGFRN